VVKGTLALGKALLFVGRRCARKPRLVREDEGSIQPFGRRADESKGCSSRYRREGIFFTYIVLRQQAVEREILCSGRLGPCSLALSSNGLRRKRGTDRGVARKRRPDRTMAFEVVLRGALVSTVRAPSKGLSRLAAPVLLLRKGKVVALLKRAARARSEFEGHAENRGLPNARESDARECVRVSE